MKKVFLIAGLICTFLLGVWVTRWYLMRSDKTEIAEATVLMERIEAVTKLITLEGSFSEIYDYEDYYGYDLDLFRKKALIRVKAKVSIGYDLEKIRITSQPESKTLSISGIPPPELLSIDHELEYYDVREGLFNSFSTKDYNELNAKAKEFIRVKAQESELFANARLDRNKLMEMIRMMVESAGWELVWEEEPGILQ